MDVFYDTFGSFHMCIADKYLTKVLIIDQSYNMCNPMFVEFIENIVQEQNWSGFGLFLYKLELGKFKGDQKGLLLALATKFLDGVARYFKI